MQSGEPTAGQAACGISSILTLRSPRARHGRLAAQLDGVAAQAVAMHEAVSFPGPDPAGALAAAVRGVQVAPAEVEPDLVAEHAAVALGERRCQPFAAAVEAGGWARGPVGAQPGLLALA